MKSIVLSGALLLSSLAVHAQTNKKDGSTSKPATVRIKKVENINGVEKITDTTYTVSDPSNIQLGDDKNIQMINIEGGTGYEKGKKVVVVTDSHVISSDDSNAEAKIVISDGEMNEEIEKALKEAGVDPKDCKGTKKMVIVNEESEPGKDGVKESKTTKIVMIKMHITDASSDVMKRLSTQIGKADNKLEMEEMKMFPNPHDGKFSLSFNLKNKGDAKVTIFNIEGKEVYSESLPNFSGDYKKDIDISSNKKGVYFVKIEQGKHTQVKKVVLE